MIEILEKKIIAPDPQLSYLELINYLQIKKVDTQVAKLKIEDEQKKFLKEKLDNIVNEYSRKNYSPDKVSKENLRKICIFIIDFYQLLSEQNSYDRISKITEKYFESPSEKITDKKVRDKIIEFHFGDLLKLLTEPLPFVMIEGEGEPLKSFATPNLFSRTAAAAVSVIANFSVAAIGSIANIGASSKAEDASDEQNSPNLSSRLISEKNHVARNPKIKGIAKKIELLKAKFFKDQEPNLKSLDEIRIDKIIENLGNIKNILNDELIDKFDNFLEEILRGMEGGYATPFTANQILEFFKFNVGKSNSIKDAILITLINFRLKELNNSFKSYFKQYPQLEKNFYKNFINNIEEQNFDDIKFFLDSLTTQNLYVLKTVVDEKFSDLLNSPKNKKVKAEKNFIKEGEKGKEKEDDEELSIGDDSASNGSSKENDKMEEFLNLLNTKYFNILPFEKVFKQFQHSLNSSDNSKIRNVRAILSSHHGGLILNELLADTDHQVILSNFKNILDENLIDIIADKLLNSNNKKSEQLLNILCQNDPNFLLKIIDYAKKEDYLKLGEKLNQVYDNQTFISKLFDSMVTDEILNKQSSNELFPQIKTICFEDYQNFGIDIKFNSFDDKCNVLIKADNLLAKRLLKNIFNLKQFNFELKTKEYEIDKYDNLVIYQFFEKDAFEVLMNPSKFIKKVIEEQNFDSQNESYNFFIELINTIEDNADEEILNSLNEIIKNKNNDSLYRLFNENSGNKNFNLIQKLKKLLDKPDFFNLIKSELLIPIGFNNETLLHAMFQNSPDFISAILKVEKNISCKKNNSIKTKIVEGLNIATIGQNFKTPLDLLRQRNNQYPSIGNQNLLVELERYQSFVNFENNVNHLEKLFFTEHYDKVNDDIALKTFFNNLRFLRNDLTKILVDLEDISSIKLPVRYAEIVKNHTKIVEMSNDFIKEIRKLLEKNNFSKEIFNKISKKYGAEFLGILADFTDFYSIKEKIKLNDHFHKLFSVSSVVIQNKENRAQKSPAYDPLFKNSFRFPTLEKTKGPDDSSDVKYTEQEITDLLHKLGIEKSLTKSLIKDFNNLYDYLLQIQDKDSRDKVVKLTDNFIDTIVKNYGFNLSKDYNTSKLQHDIENYKNNVNKVLKNLPISRAERILQLIDELLKDILSIVAIIPPLKIKNNLTLSFFSTNTRHCSQFGNKLKALSKKIQEIPESQPVCITLRSN